jgi:putative transposase
MQAAASQPVTQPAPSRIHLVTLQAAHRQTPFGDFEVARCVAEVGTARTVWRDGRLLAWVLMPDHWLGLVEVGALDSLATAVTRMKTRTTRAVHRQQTATGKLWDGAYEERTLAPDEDVTDAARRLVARPLRAGLVQKIGDYPFWDAIWM